MVKEMGQELSSPCFSVIIPSYNRAHTLGKTLDSVLAQSHSCYEIIVIDDGSTDGTPAMIQKYLDQGVRYVYQENAGVCTARNNGASLSTKGWLVFLDSDDWVDKNWLADFAKAMEKRDVNIVFCSVLKIVPKGQKVIDARDPYQEGGKEAGLFLSGAFALQKSLFEKAGGYDSIIQFGENTELSLRLRKEGLSKAFTGRVGMHYFPPEDGGSRNLANSIRSNLYILEKHQDWFKQNPRVKQLYLQTVGVGQIRLGKLEDGRKNLWKGWIICPIHLKAFLRAGIGLVPVLAKYVWKKDFK
jgi:glycosyltransferase involved in cell wall biosynthesis